jgi:hypothetical protein
MEMKARCFRMVLSARNALLCVYALLGGSNRWRGNKIESLSAVRHSRKRLAVWSCCLCWCCILKLPDQYVWVLVRRALIFTGLSTCYIVLGGCWRRVLRTLRFSAALVAGASEEGWGASWDPSRVGVKVSCLSAPATHPLGVSSLARAGGDSGSSKGRLIEGALVARPPQKCEGGRPLHSGG